jgi:hypothetical protein
MRSIRKLSPTRGRMARLCLWLGGCVLVAPAARAQCTSPTTIPPGSYTAGDHSYTDANAMTTSTSAPGFQLSGTATGTFSAGNCIQLVQRFSATGSGVGGGADGGFGVAVGKYGVSADI